ncbi:hypothetical protein M408DRAFT_19719 [Serendipita vermifera MAFF 305830]|uniref:Uncharacterized protein n=1 Tax=Serendipita vermifera MAFF 305830 TaxID=933852 RepID=A0A0C3BPP1_SERVB|nr:hypothetical protein M408DRAFT_19719 [Serendipita vermifera MAFF 305830]
MSTSPDPTCPHVQTDADGQLVNFIHVVFGIFVWDFVNTLRIEMDWRNLLHWVNEGRVLAVSSHKVDQKAILVLISWAEASIMASGTTVLVLRVAAVWKEKRRILFPLLFLSAVHWALLYASMLTSFLRQQDLTVPAAFPFRKLWLSPLNDEPNPTFCTATILLSAGIYTTIFHAVLLVSVSWGNHVTGASNGSLRDFIGGDCCYFVVVLLASIMNLVLSCICVTRDIHQGLRIAACTIIGLAACRIFRRFDAHHRPKMTEEAVPIVVATRKLASKSSIIALRRASSWSTSRPSTARQDRSIEEVYTEHSRVNPTCYA